MKSLCLTILMIVSYAAYSFADVDDDRKKNYYYMNTLALEVATDKSSSHHNYTEVYSQYLDKYRNQPIKFLEIGIFEGRSVKLWEKYFPLGQLYFIDITDRHLKYRSERSKYYFLDQANRDELLEFISKVGGDFDVIIDDGGHRMEQQIVSFKTLFPYVKSGGLYIIEDLHTSYWKDFGGNGSPKDPKAGEGTAVHFLQGLIDDVNYVGASTAKASHDHIPQTMSNSLSEYQKDIYSIHFYDSLCIILKR